MILLNPQNEEAIYYLAKLKLRSSDYKKSKELNDRLKSFVINFVLKVKNLKLKLKIYLKNKCNFKIIRKRILIIDFGSQVTKLIARRVRELGVYSEIITPQRTLKK